MGLVLVKAVIIAKNRPGPNIGLGPDCAVTQIGQMIGLGPCPDRNLLDLYKIANMRLWANIGTGP